MLFDLATHNLVAGGQVDLGDGRVVEVGRIEAVELVLAVFLPGDRHHLVFARGEVIFGADGLRDVDGLPTRIELSTSSSSTVVSGAM